jgi:hypothetical protein
MFNDVDETLRQFLIAEVPIERAEVDVSFDRPTREWASRLSKPVINVFLFDVRERAGYRDDTPAFDRNSQGGVTRHRQARRIDLSYMITAWTREPDDEHRILSRVMAAMFRCGEIESRHLQGSLVYTAYPVLARIMPPDHLAKPVDIWGVMDNELHASLVWVVTAPLEAFAPVEGPLVRTVELAFGELNGDWRERFVEVAGVAHRSGSPLETIAGVEIAVAGTALRATTGPDGKFRFANVPPGDHILRVVTPAGDTRDQPMTIPAASYDVEL